MVHHIQVVLMRGKGEGMQEGIEERSEGKKQEGRKKGREKEREGGRGGTCVGTERVYSTVTLLFHGRENIIQWSQPPLGYHQLAGI